MGNENKQRRASIGSRTSSAASTSHFLSIHPSAVGERSRSLHACTAHDPSTLGYRSGERWKTGRKYPHESTVGG
jgi:hypothetical protein